jgi:protein-tyrosine kinase
MGKLFDALEKSRQDTSSGDAQIPAPQKTGAEKILNTTASDPPHDFVHRPSVIQGSDAKVMDEPKLPKNIHPSIITLVKPHSLEAEQFRLLKNNILFPETGTPPRTIMITSPSPDEGKSFVSANLAVSIAKSIDEYVLLMDCDLRAPSLHQLFNIRDGQGLSDHLSRGKPLSALLKKTFINKLTLLPGGTIPPNPSELLSSEQMRNLLDEVKSRYADRYVIIDTPPPYITSETNAMARIVDGIIIVIRYGKTRKKEVEDIIDIYGKEKILGVIKNFSKKQPVSDYRYRHYGYTRG